MITPDMLIPKLLIIANIGMGLLLAYLDINIWRKSFDATRWIRLFYALIGLYWAGLYLYMLIFNEDPKIIQIFVRPGITVTLAGMASGAIIKARK